MNRNEEHQHQADCHAGRGKWVLIGFLLVAAFFLLTEHQAHFFGVLPFLLLLACPLMHLFHHRHGHRGEREKDGVMENRSSADTGRHGKDAS